MSLKNRKRKELDLEIGKEKKEKNGSTLGQEHEMDTKSKWLEATYWKQISVHFAIKIDYFISFSFKAYFIFL